MKKVIEKIEKRNLAKDEEFPLDENIVLHEKKKYPFRIMKSIVLNKKK